MSLALELADVAFAYPGGPRVLEGVNVRVERGEFVAVAGPNGGGKTTLVRVALGLERPTAGTARLVVPAARVAYLAQRSQLLIDAPATVREVVTAGRLPASRLVGPLRAGDRPAVEAAI